jgi:hypothetical protein
MPLRPCYAFEYLAQMRFSIDSMAVSMSGLVDTCVSYSPQSLQWSITFIRVLGFSLYTFDLTA